MQFNDLILFNQKEKDSFQIYRPMKTKFLKQLMFFMNCSSPNQDLNSIKKSKIITSDFFRTRQPYQETVCLFCFIDSWPIFDEHCNSLN